MFRLEVNINKVADFASLVDIIKHFNQILDFALSETFKEEIEQIQKREKCDEITFSITSNVDTTELIAKLWYFDEYGMIDNYEAVSLLTIHEEV